MDKDKKMPLDELRQRPEFLRLTEKQQMFVSTYIAADQIGHYDPKSAVTTAYNVTPESARTMPYSMMQNPRIIDVLNIYYGRDAHAAFLEEVSRAIRNRSLSLAQVEAMQLKSRLLGIGCALKGRPRSRPLKAEKAPKKSKKTKEREEAPVEPTTTPEAW